MNKDEIEGDSRRAVTLACLALLAAMSLSGCGGDSVSPGVATPASTASLKGADGVSQGAVSPGPALASGQSAPATPVHRPAPASQLEASQLARVKALPLLAALSDREKLGLLRQLGPASPSERHTAIYAYPKLASLPDRQQQILLSQLEGIVPVTTPARSLVCQCNNEVTRKMCVRESCADRMELQSLCNRACGTLGALKAHCGSAAECTRSRLDLNALK